jgi:hypothetical protein
VRRAASGREAAKGDEERDGLRASVDGGVDGAEGFGSVRQGRVQQPPLMCTYTLVETAAGVLFIYRFKRVTHQARREERSPAARGVGGAPQLPQRVANRGGGGGTMRGRMRMRSASRRCCRRGCPAMRGSPPRVRHVMTKLRHASITATPRVTQHRAPTPVAQTLSACMDGDAKRTLRAACALANISFVKNNFLVS